jgi:hypothetical protein
MNIPNSKDKRKQLWIGKVEARPIEGSSKWGDAKGAFVDIVTWASNSEEFHHNASLVLETLELFVIGVENEETLLDRKAKENFDEETEDMISRALDNPDAIVYGTFHTWEADSA